MSQLLELLLSERNLTKDELTPDYSRLHDPLLLPDMEKARDRILEAILRNESITVFSDYDADGIPGAVVMADFFKTIGYQNYSIYIPHRHNEGFGLNKEFIEECKAKFLITIDCGTADIEEIKLAEERGIDVIVTDHHESSVLPNAYAVINPKRADSGYPFKDLCGSALAFKLVQAILAKNSFGVKEGLEKWSLDMVGIATLSDMVPLVGENRILASFGLQVLRKSLRPGILALCDKLKMAQRFLTEDDVAFMITPRINAASRMGKPEDAFNLLATDKDLEAKVLVDHLEKINHERKGAVASMVKAAKHDLGKRDLKEVIVIGNPEWRPSLLGLVANSLVGEYMRPIFIWGRDGDNKLKGSCRSYNGYDLYQLMEATKDSFVEFGGHKGAGGFTTDLEKLVTLEEKLSEALEAVRPPLGGRTAKCIQIRLEDINEELWQTVSLFAPFGVGNEKPVFKIVNAPVKNIRQFGKGNEHFEIVLSNGIKAVSFYSPPPSPADSFNLHFNLEKSYFRSTPELRLRIVTIEK